MDACVLTSSSCSPLVSTIKTDWSRTSRTKLALLKAGSNRNQAKITSFFDRIMNLMTINPNVFQNSSIQAISTTQDTTVDVSPLLQRLYANAQRNAAS